MSKSDKRFKIGGEPINVEVKIKHSWGVTSGSTRLLTLLPVIRLKDKAHALIMTRMEIRSGDDQSNKLVYDINVHKKFGTVFNISDDDYRGICSNYRRSSGLHNRLRISIPYTNQVVHDNMSKEKWAIAVRRLINAPGKVKSGPQKRDKATGPVESPATTFKHQLIEEVMDEVGERIPQAVIDGFNQKLEGLKAGIVKEVALKIKQHVDRRLDEFTSKFAESPKANLKEQDKIDIVSEVLTRVIAHVDEKWGLPKDKTPDKKRTTKPDLKVITTKPERQVPKCAGLYAVDFTCDGGQDEVACSWRDDCMALTAIRVKEGVSEEARPEWLAGLMQGDMDGKIIEGLELLTGPDKVTPAGG